MPIVRSDDDIASSREQYVCIIASIGGGATKKGVEPDVAHLFSLYPHADVYAEYKKNNVKNKLGSYKIIKGSGQKPVIIMFTRRYPGFRDMPNDNAGTRRDFFERILDQLLGKPNFSSFSFSASQLDDNYITILDDFTKTYELRQRKPLTIKIYGNVSSTSTKPVSKPSNTNDGKTFLDMTGITFELPVLYQVDFAQVTVASQQEQAQEQQGQSQSQTQTEQPEQHEQQEQSQTQTEQPEQQEQHEQKEEQQEQSQTQTEQQEQEQQQQEQEEYEEVPGLIELFPDTPEWNWLINDSRAQMLLDKIQQELGDDLYADDTFPEPEEIFNAFQSCPKPKVIILGQDPYPTRGNAHGLSFSVKMGVKIPMSLHAIYGSMAKEEDGIEGFKKPKHGNLLKWAQQGVLLLNTSLTVKENNAGSHLEIWKEFTDHVISKIALHYQKLVFVLWGVKAKDKKRLIDKKRGHLILEHCHPTARGVSFAKTCDSMSKINPFLIRNNIKPIDWNLTNSRK